MKSNQNIPLMPVHFDNERLIEFLDGEMDEAAGREVELHLESCWDCRIRLSEIERSIENFFKFRNREMWPPQDEIPPSGQATDQLRAQIAAFQSLTPTHTLIRKNFTGIRSTFKRVASIFEFSSYSLRKQVLLARALTAVIVVSLIVTFVLMFGRYNLVSASELLDRAIYAQASAINEISQPVIHQQINIRKNGSSNSSAVLEIWSDTVNGRVKTKTGSEQRVSSFIAEISSVLDGNRMNTQRPLSAASYKTWSDSILSKTETVTQEKDTLYLATSPNAELGIGQITEAKFAVRKSDYHPIALFINVKTDGGDESFELVEEQYQIVSLKDVDPIVFNEGAVAAIKPESPIANPILSPGSSPEVPTNTATTVASNASTSAVTAAEEIEVLQILNQVKADLGEQITVSRENGLLFIRGIVETDSRKREILTALQQVAGRPTIRIEVKTLAEALAAEKNRSKSPTTVERLQTDSDSNAVESELTQHFGSAEAARAFSTRVVNRSRTAQTRIYALKRLITQISTAELRDMKPESRDKWLSIVSRHASAYRSEISALRGELQDVFDSAGSGTASIPAVSDWSDVQAAVTRLAELDAANDKVIRSAFAVTGGSAQISMVRSAQFWANLRAAEALAGKLAILK